MLLITVKDGSFVFKCPSMSRLGNSEPACTMHKDAGMETAKLIYFPPCASEPNIPSFFFL